MFNSKHPAPCRLALLALGLCAACAVTAQPLRDPMQPPGFYSSNMIHGGHRAAGYTLNSTFITRDSKSAIINGHRVVVGSVVGGARVIDILPTKVRLRRGGRLITLYLLPITVKTPAITE